MPDKRQHRGPHPRDEQLFGADQIPALRQAVADLSWLLTGGYAEKSSLKLVGDRYRLEERQRTAVLRSACSDRALANRRQRCCGSQHLAGCRMMIDGYNLLTTIEAALAGGVLLICRDGCVRDMASMHGTYRRVAETVPAIELAGSFLVTLHVDSCRWLLDQPVSNSGRLKQMMLKLADEHGWPWNVELLADPDPVLAEASDVVVSADHVVLDGCRHWFNLARSMVKQLLPQAWQVDLSDAHS